MCLRHKTADQLWFSFFHEACHILLHSKKRTYVAYLNEQSHEELEANAFAADIMIQPSAWAGFTSYGSRRKPESLSLPPPKGLPQVPACTLGTQGSESYSVCSLTALETRPSATATTPSATQSTSAASTSLGSSQSPG